MLRVEKLLERARKKPRDVRFSGLVRSVEAVGLFVIRRRGTSHRRYVHPW